MAVNRGDKNLALGIVLLILGTVCFAIQDGITKKLIADYSVWQIISVRFATLVVAVVAYEAWRKRTRMLLQPAYPKLQLARALVMLIEITAITYAFVYLELAEAITAFYIYPILVLAIGVTVLQEPVDVWTFVAVVFGFVGLVVAFGPSWETKPHGIVLALVAAVANAALIILTRFVSDKESASTNLFYMATLCAILPAVFFWNTFEQFRSQDALDILMMCILHGAAHTCIILALSLARASALQPYTYLQILWTIVVGFTMFGEIPKGEVLFGVVLIVSGGVLAMARSRS